MNEETIAYRLDSIEETLRQLKDVILTTQRQQDQIDALQKNQETMQKTLEGIQKDVQELKVRPAEADSKRWRYIVDYIFKAVVAAAVGGVFIKMGISS